MVTLTAGAASWFAANRWFNREVENRVNAEPMPGPVTRRELLSTFLGTTAAVAGCGGSRLELPPGELVGASHALGHRIRDGLTVSVPANRWRDCQVVIVGGGIAGLSAARRLIQAGVDDFVLLELEADPGGTARAGRVAGTACPWGAHYLPVPFADNRALVTLLDELGVLEGHDAEGEPIVAEQFLCRDPQERVFYKGHWYEGLYLRTGADAEDLRQLAAFEAEVDRWTAWRDDRGRRAFTLPIADGSDDPVVTDLDRQTITDWLGQRGLTSPRLHWLIDYSCRDDFGMRAAETSAWAGLFYFASRRRGPGHRGQPIITWPEGNGRIVSQLARGIGGRMHTGTAVVEIAPVTRDDDRLGVDVTAVDDHGRGAIGFRARHVIFAGPRFLARYLVRPWRSHPPARDAEFEYGSWMVANVAVRDRPAGRGFPLAWDNVLVESPSLGYVVATHQSGPEHGPTVLTYYYPLADLAPGPGRRRLLEAGRDEWAEVVLSDLAMAHHDIRRQVTAIDVMRWGHAMIRPRPGFVWGTARRAAQQPFRAIHFANTDLSGVALFEEAFYHGTRAAEEILTATGNNSPSIL